VDIDTVYYFSRINPSFLSTLGHEEVVRSEAEDHVQAQVAAARALGPGLEDLVVGGEIGQGFSFFFAT